jgi:hypothetical protein
MKPTRILLCLLLVMATLLWANPLITGVVSRNAQWPPQGSNYSFGGPYEIAWQAVPTSVTVLSTRDTHIIGYCFYNSTGGNLSLTIITKDASPLPLPVSGPIAAGVSVCNNAPYGILSKGGWSVSASGTGVYFSAMWSN